MFDTHAHFDIEPFFDDLDEIARQTLEAGVRGAVNPAIHLASSRRALEVHARHPWVLPCLGIHPLYLGDAPHPPVEEIETLAEDARFAAVGEVGLDFWHGRDDEQRQREHLSVLAAVATRRGLPLLLHSRKSLYETLAAVRAAGFHGEGIVHAFSGSYEMAQKALDAGFYLSACANITYPRKARLREVFACAPRDRVVVETDAPDIPPWERRGQVHRPWDLPRVVSALAEVWKESPERAAEITEENARRLFGIKG
jgi:TatD DNase family protein